MNKRKFILACSVSICFIILVLSCDKKVGKLPVPVAPLPVGACDTITYTKHIKPIMDTKCNNCHGNPTSGGAPFSLVSYSEVKNIADNGTLKATSVDGAPKLMPFGGPPLPQAQKDLITCWLNNGKKQ